MKINSSFLKIFSSSNSSSQPRIYTCSSSQLRPFFEFEFKVKFGKKIEFFRVRSPATNYNVFTVSTNL